MCQFVFWTALLKFNTVLQMASISNKFAFQDVLSDLHEMQSTHMYPHGPLCLNSFAFSRRFLSTYCVPGMGTGARAMGVPLKNAHLGAVRDASVLTQECPPEAIIPATLTAVLLSLPVCLEPMPPTSLERAQDSGLANQKILPSGRRD